MRKTTGDILMNGILKLISCHIQTQPVLGGSVHIAMIVITLLGFFGICYTAPKAGHNAHRAVLLFSSGLLLVFEVIKQAILIYSDGTYQYDLHHLPLQPCSSLMYATFLAGLLYNSKSRLGQFLRDAFLCYSVVFGFFSGMCAVALPMELFKTEYGVLIYQSLQHHVVLALTAVYISAGGIFRFCRKSYTSALGVFTGFCVLAFVLNLTCYAIWHDIGFNMMYVGPYKLWPIPLVSSFVTIKSYAVHLPVYFIGYTVCAFVVSAGCYGAQKLAGRLCPAVHAHS